MVKVISNEHYYKSKLKLGHFIMCRTVYIDVVSLLSILELSYKILKVGPQSKQMLYWMASGQCFLASVVDCD